MPYAHITGWGMAVPEGVMTNDDLAKIVDTNDTWIRERTGIRERRVARENEFASTLGLEAAFKALGLALRDALRRPRIPWRQMSILFAGRRLWLARAVTALWRLQAGALTPSWSDHWTIHHWTFTDSTGAEYRLTENVGGVWRGKEGLLARRALTGPTSCLSTER